MIEPGALLQNRYRVVKQIGQGGMGAVYVATDERFHSTVAIKQTFFDDPTLLTLSSAGALLNHCATSRCPESGPLVEGDGQFLVLEFTIDERPSCCNGAARSRWRTCAVRPNFSTRRTCNARTAHVHRDISREHETHGARQIVLPTSAVERRGT